MGLRSLLVIGAALGIAGCGDDHPVRPSPSDLLTPRVLACVRLAPDQVGAAGVTLGLSTYLWRDFMPPAPVDGEPLRAALSVTTADSSAFPAALTADAAWVLNGDTVWATPVEETSPRVPGDPTLRVLAAGGPKWGPGIEVDVVVRLRAGGGAWYLRARSQIIHRTD